MTRLASRTTRLAALALVALSLQAPLARAVNPDEMLADAALEQRARIISQDLRCLVCQNQSIDDSNAPLAKDLRIIVRERLVAGDSDRAVIDYVVARYGNYVLLKPPLQGDTALLWLAPFLIFATALMVSGFYFFRRRGLAEDGAAPAATPSQPLQPEDQ